MSNLTDDLLSQRELSDAHGFEASLEQLCSAYHGSEFHTTSILDDRGMCAVANAILRHFHMSEVEPSDKLDNLNAYLDYALRPAGITWRQVALVDEWWRDCPNPMIAELSSGQAVALLPRPWGGYDVFDPSTGRTEKLSKADRSQISGNAFCIYEPLPQRPITSKELIRFMASSVGRSDAFILLVANLLASLVALLPVYANLIVFNRILEYGFALPPAIAAMLVTAAVSSALFAAMKSLVISRISQKIELRTEAAVVSRLLTLPVQFFRSYSAGELSAYATSVRLLCQELTNQVLSSVLAALFALIYLVQIATFAPGMVWPCFVIIVLTAGTTAAFAAWKTKFEKRLTVLDANVNGIEYSLLSGIQKLRLAHAERRAFSRWADTYAKDVAVRYNPPVGVKAASAVSALVTALSMIVIYVIAAHLNMRSGDFMAFSSAYGGISAAFLVLAQAVPSFAAISSSLKALSPILQATPETSEDAIVVTELDGNVTFENVSFRYGENGPVIADELSFSIEQGQYVAIVGKSGCGKSSLINLMLGFETPQCGAILYDGRDMATLDKMSLRKLIGVVEQDGRLFRGSVMSNIEVAMPGLTEEQAWEAARIASIADDIEKMPMKMNTHISDGSGGVSGGQRQRILIARAVAGKPSLLIMDEATSALDNVTQKTVTESLDKLNCTRIVVAHRLSTIQQCNRILYLEKGKIIEDGTYEELVSKKGAFFELVQRQSIDLED